LQQAFGILHDPTHPGTIEALRYHIAYGAFYLTTSQHQVFPLAVGISQNRQAWLQIVDQFLECLSLALAMTLALQGLTFLL
jgi:hypothetical protein